MPDNQFFKNNYSSIPISSVTYRYIMNDNDSTISILSIIKL